MKLVIILGLPDKKTVVDSLSMLKCTRIVITHWLSTIKECDRIIVLDAGQVFENGSYNELITKNSILKS